MDVRILSRTMATQTGMILLLPTQESPVFVCQRAVGEDFSASKGVITQLRPARLCESRRVGNQLAQPVPIPLEVYPLGFLRLSRM